MGRPLMPQVRGHEWGTRYPAGLAHIAGAEHTWTPVGHLWSHRYVNDMGSMTLIAGMTYGLCSESGPDHLRFAGFVTHRDMVLLDVTAVGLSVSDSEEASDKGETR
jgi:hypothetical protein